MDDQKTRVTCACGKIDEARIGYVWPVDHHPSGCAPEEHLYAVGDGVYKIGGDYNFVGTVVAAFEKRSGAKRYVVENNDGVLHIYSGKNLRRR